MEIVSGGAARADYRDRNPITKPFTTGVLNPGAAARSQVEWTYTVPAGKKAIFELGHAWVENDSATAPNARASVQIEYVSGATTYEAPRVEIANGESTRFRADSVTPGKLLVAGDILRGSTNVSNTAVGSNIFCLIAALITEYDA